MTRLLTPSWLSLAAIALTIGPVSAAPQVYVPLGEANQVHVVDAVSHRVVGTIDGVGNAHGLSITPGGRYLVAGSLSVESSTSDNTPVRPASVSEEEHAQHHAKPSKEGMSSAGKSYLSVIDTVLREVVRRVEVPGPVHHVAVSPSGKFALATHPGTGSISAVDLERFEVVAAVATGSVPNYAVFSGDGRRAYVSNAGDDNVAVVDVATWSVGEWIATGRSPEHVVLSADGQTLYTNNVADGTASAVSLDEGRVVRTFPVGSSPHGIDLSDDNTTLFVASKADNRLVAIDLASGESRQVPLAPAPYHLIAVPGSGTLYVSSRADSRIWVIDQKTLAQLGDVAIGGIGHQMAVSGGASQAKE